MISMKYKDCRKAKNYILIVCPFKFHRNVKRNGLSLWRWTCAELKLWFGKIWRELIINKLFKLYFVLRYGGLSYAFINIVHLIQLNSIEYIIHGTYNMCKQCNMLHTNDTRQLFNLYLNKKYFESNEFIIVENDRNRLSLFCI